MNPVRGFFGLFGSFFNFIGDSLAYVTGGLEERRKKMGRSTYIIDQKAQNIKNRKIKGTQDLFNAIASLEVEKGHMEHEVSREETNLQNADENRQGAAALAKERVAALGGDSAKAMVDDEYLDHKSAYERYNQEYEEAKKRLDGDGTSLNIGLRAELKAMSDEIENYDRQLKESTRDVQEVDRIKSRTIADMRIADAKQRAAAQVTGVSSEQDDNELNELRQMGLEARAKGNVAGRLAGSSTQSQDAKYKAAARRSTTGDSFDAMMGFNKKEEAAPAAPAKLPEN